MARTLTIPRQGSAAFRVLMLCVGNVCRSPMAAALWRDRFGGRGMLVESAGLAALVGHPVDPFAEAVLAGHGLSARPHVAREATAALLDAADLVLVMQRAHVEAVRALSPCAAERTCLIGAWADGIEIADPHRRPREAFERAYEALARAIDGWHAQGADAPGAQTRIPIDAALPTQPRQPTQPIHLASTLE